MSKIVPIEESFIGTLGQTINPGDKVVTFTQVYGRGTRICTGTFLGLTKKEHGWGMDIGYWVGRAGGTRTKMHYPNMVLVGTTLEELDDRVM